MSRSVVLWSVAAVAGVVLVAGVTYAASSLSSQAIGLSSEPPGAGDALTPGPAESATATATPDRAAARRRAATRRRAAARRRARGTPVPTTTPTSAPTVAPPVTTPDDDGGGGSGDDSSGESGGDSGGQGRGRGRGRGGDDD